MSYKDICSYKPANAASRAATGAPLGFLGCDSAAAAISRWAYGMGVALLRMCLSRPDADLAVTVRDAVQ
jgi:hypothetical protein